MSASPSIRIPQYHELMWPALQATKVLGGSAIVREMNERVVDELGLTEVQQAVPHLEGRMSELEYRLHWARTHLKGIGALQNSARGVWAITDHGLALTEKQMLAETKAWRAGRRAARKVRHAGDAQEEAVDATEGLEATEDATGATWKDALIARWWPCHPPDSSA
jgi:restriction system protein